MREELVTITCDYAGCGKKFLLHDDNMQNTPGIEDTYSSMDAMGARLYFCTELHLWQHHYIEWKKESGQEEKVQKVEIPQSGNDPYVEFAQGLKENKATNREVLESGYAQEFVAVDGFKLEE